MIRRLIHLYGSELLYHLGGETYDRVERILFNGSWRCWRQAAVELIPSTSRSILDLGAGSGAMGRAYLPSRPATTFIAVEPSRPMIGRRNRRPIGERAVQAKASRLPVRNGSIDAVIVGFPGPYIWDLASWDEMARVLAPGGYVITLIGGVPVQGVPRSIVGKVIGWVVYGRYERMQHEHRSHVIRAPLVRHPGFIGYWREIETERGSAIVWLARKRERASGKMEASKSEPEGFRS